MKIKCTECREIKNQSDFEYLNFGKKERSKTCSACRDKVRTKIHPHKPRQEKTQSAYAGQINVSYRYYESAHE